MAILEELNAGEDTANIDELLYDEDEEFVPPTEEEIARFKRNVQLEREKYQPSNAEKIMAFAKALVLRALVVFFLMWVFKRQTLTHPAPVDSDAEITPEHEEF